MPDHPNLISRKAQVGKSSVSQSIYNLKDASKMLNFLTAHSIMDMAGLDEKFSSMLGEQLDIRDKLKPIERRLPVLKKNLEQTDIYLKFKGKKSLNEADKILFLAAKNYLDGVMNGSNSPERCRRWTDKSSPTAAFLPLWGVGYLDNLER